MSPVCTTFRAFGAELRKDFCSKAWTPRAGNLECAGLPALYVSQHSKINESKAPASRRTPNLKKWPLRGLNLGEALQLGRENSHLQKLILLNLDLGQLPLPTATAGLRTVEYAMPSPKAATP